MASSPCASLQRLPSMCTSASKFLLLIRIPVTWVRAHPSDLALTWSSLWGPHLQIKLHFGIQCMNCGGCNSTSNSCKVRFSKFSSPCSNLSLSWVTKLSPNSSLCVRALPQPCFNVSLFFHYPTRPIFLYTAVQLHYSRIPNIPHFPASKPMLMRLFLPRIPSSSASTAHLRCPLLHYAFPVPLRHVSSSGLCFGTLLAVKDYDHCITITLWSLLLACIFLKSLYLPTLAQLSEPFLF